jgi:opacity protein-like surface antigen
MAKMSHSAKWKAAFVSLSLFLSFASFAQPSKAPASPQKLQPEDHSLQGWDGKINPCADLSLPACWTKIPPAKYEFKKTWYPVVSLGAGLIITSTIGESRSFPVQVTGGPFYIYNAQKPSQSGALFELFLGSEWAFHPHWALQFGADLDQVYTNYNANGTLIQGTDLSTASYFKYNYSAISKQLMAEAKLLFTLKEKIHPYLLGALGASFNTAYNFNTNSSPAAFTQDFGDNTTTAFTYALGLGVDFDIREEIRLGVGYRFSDLGRVSLGSASINNVPASGTISQPHLYSNIVLGQITFVF